MKNIILLTPPQKNPNIEKFQDNAWRGGPIEEPI